MVTEDRIELEKNAPFEEIGKDWYVHLLVCVPPERWCNPYRDGGWFFTGEPYSHDWDTGEAYHFLCFEYAGKYYAGCRSVEKAVADYEWEISAFCRELNRRKISPSRIVSPLGARRLSNQHQSSKERKKWKN